MVTAQSFWKHLKSRDYTFFSGVPCTILKGILREALSDPQVTYVAAPKENIALGVAGGAWLAGRKSGILIQNSGLGNIINALTSYNMLYKVPVLMFITWRGFEGKDSPEHIFMGEKTLPVLGTLNIPHVIMSDRFEGEIDWAIEEMKKHCLPVAVILKSGLVT